MVFGGSSSPGLSGGQGRVASSLCRAKIVVFGKTLVHKLHMCNHAHTSLQCITQSQYFLVMWPRAQPKVAVMMIFVVC